MPPAPDFPPLIAGHRLDRRDDPFVVAVRRAAGVGAHAGDLFWSGADDRMVAAIVLEPAVDATVVQVIHLAVMVALGDCVGALAPPEVGVFYRWPDRILVNGAVVGSARFAASAVPDRRSVPAWLVAGVDVRIRPARPVRDPGLTADVTTLWDEGCADLRRTPLLESFARHLKAWIYTFEDDGAGPVIEAWLARAEGRGAAVAVGYCGGTRSGTFLGLDEHGDLLLKTEQGTELLSLADALA